MWYGSYMPTDRVLICGDRNWGLPNGLDAEALALATQQRCVLATYVATLPTDSIIIEGEAKGADRFAGIYAEAVGLEVLRFPAQWDKHGRAAGPIRNKQMLTEGKPTLVVAFHDDIENSKGTKNMLTQAKRASVPTRVITSSNVGLLLEVSSG